MFTIRSYRHPVLRASPVRQIQLHSGTLLPVAASRRLTSSISLQLPTSALQQHHHDEEDELKLQETAQDDHEKKSTTPQFITNANQLMRKTARNLRRWNYQGKGKNAIQTWNKLQRKMEFQYVLNGAVSVPFDLVRQVLAGIQNVHGTLTTPVINLFQSIPMLTNRALTAADYLPLIRLTFASRDFVAAATILDVIRAKGLKPCLDCYSLVICILMSKKQWQYCAALLKEMEQEHDMTQKPVQTLTRFLTYKLSVLAELRRFDEAKELYSQFIDAHGQAAVCPSMLSAMVHATESSQEAQDLFRSIPREELLPCIYIGLLRVLLRNGECETAMSILEEFNQDDKEIGWRDVMIVYDVICRHLLAQGRFSDAGQLIQMMVKKVPCLASLTGVPFWDDEAQLATSNNNNRGVDIALDFHGWTSALAQGAICNILLTNHEKTAALLQRNGQIFVVTGKNGTGLLKETMPKIARELIQSDSAARFCSVQLDSTNQGRFVLANEQQ